MRTTIDIENDVLAVARELAHAQGRPLGSVVSDLMRIGLTAARIDSSGSRPVIRAPSGSPPITPEMVRAGLEEL